MPMDIPIILLITFASLLVLFAILTASLWCYFTRKRCFSMVEHFETAESRRAAHPPGQHPVCRDHCMDGIVKEWGYKDGLFWQSFTPATAIRQDVNIHASAGNYSESHGKKLDAVVVGFHGYCDHSDFGMQWHAQEILKLNNACTCKSSADSSCTKNCKNSLCISVVLFDQPGFGRSDGLWGYLPDWFGHIAECRKFVDFVKQMYPGVPVYGLGFSCGGGILVSIEAVHAKRHHAKRHHLQKEHHDSHHHDSHHHDSHELNSNVQRDESTTVFDGMILLAPMLAIEESMQPSPIIKTLLKFAARIFPTWPVGISAHSGELSYRDPTWHLQSRLLNKLQYPGFPRLATALALIKAVEWMPKVFELVKTPYLLLHGTADFVTCINGSKKFHANNGSMEKKFIVLDGYRHHILGPGQGEEHNEKPYEQIRGWLKQGILSRKDGNVHGKSHVHEHSHEKRA